jgi:hypothetical protein
MGEGMMGSSAGSKYYYDKGCVRIQVKLDPKTLFALKNMAIDKDSSIVSITQEAVVWMLENAGMIPVDFPSISEAKYFYTFVHKDEHKQLKKVALAADRSLCELVGFMLGVWAKANGKT